MAISSMNLGQPIRTFRFGRAPIQGQFVLFLVAIVVGLIIAGLQPEIILLISIAGVVIIAALWGLSVWSARPVQIDLYKTGLGCGDRHWLWTELDTLIVASTPAGEICLLYANENLAFELERKDAQFAELIDWIKQKTLEAHLPELVDRYRAGTAIQFGNVAVSQEGIRQNDSLVPLTEIGDYIFQEKDQLVVLRQRDGTPVLCINLPGLANTHLLVSLLQTLLPTGKVQS